MDKSTDYKYLFTKLKSEISLSNLLEKPFVVYQYFLSSLFSSGGVLAGAIWQQNGFLREIGQKFPALNRITDYYSNNFYRDNYYNNKNNYNNYNGYNNYNNFYGGGQMQHGGQYNDHNQDQNVHRTRVILPGMILYKIIIMGLYFN